MAINSTEKRKSISGSPLPLTPGVTPNSLKDQDWRFEAAGSYIGYLYEINTAVKRRAISGIPLPLSPGVTPDVSKGKRWRYQSAHGTLVLSSNYGADNNNVIHATVRDKRIGMTVRDKRVAP